MTNFKFLIPNEIRMTKAQNIKVVIAAGGDGTRLGDLNSDKKPKSLLLFNERPLIAYQLEKIIDLAPLGILLSFTNELHIEEFKDYVRKGIIPEFEYQFGLHSPFEHQKDLFCNKSTQDFIEDIDFLFTHGDLVLKKNIFKSMQEAYARNSCSVIVKEKAKESDEYEFVTKNSYIKKIQKSKTVVWRYGGVFIIKKEDQIDWMNMCKSKVFRSLNFFEKCIARKSKIFVVDCLQGDWVININKPEDYFEAKKYFEENRITSVLK